jgi:transcriptional regulator with XRE-family HTH domain
MPRLEMADAFAEVLRKHRSARQLSQEALAEKAEIHPTHVGLIERGERNPSLNVSSAIARALGVNLSELIREAEQIQRNR